MKKYLFIFLIGFANQAISQVGGVGINTDKPTNMLHVIDTKDPLKLEGVQGGNGTEHSLVIDDNGIVRKSPVSHNYSFTYPSAINTGGISLTTTTGAVPYTKGASLSALPGGASGWKKIPGVEREVEILNGNNSLSFNIEGEMQYADANPMPKNSAVSIAVGVFIEGKLESVRVIILKADAYAGTTQPWTLLGHAENVPAGKHKIEVYATRRDNSPDPSVITNPVPTSPVYIGQTSGANMNDFMTRVVLNVSGVYK